jgi:tetratricopeptide (TPR) repeat protein
MKYFFTLIFLLLVSRPLLAQYPPVDQAVQTIRNAKTPAEKFRGYRGLDRYCYTTGLYDSSAILQKKMYAIAGSLKNDSLMVLVYRAIGNRLVTRTDYNFALSAYFKGLDYAKTDESKATFYGNLAYVYAITGNDQVALSYLRKFESFGNFPSSAFFKNILCGLVFNNLNKPDSALIYLQKAGSSADKNNDPTLVSISLAQSGKAYELKGDADLAEVYYKRVVTYCKKQNLASGQIRHGSLYCDFCIKSGNYAQAKAIALENLAVAKKAGITEGMSTVAEILRKVYAHEMNKDSAYYYAVMQIEYKDSISSQKRIAEFQNLTFGQQLREIDEQAKTAEAAEQRKQNIQYALIALGIITIIILFLMASRSMITNTKMIEFLGVLALLIVFEFINLLVHPFLERVTHHSPVLMLLALVCIAALLVPLHHRLEKWTTKKLVIKNKAVRLAAAKRTIEKLERINE